MNHVRVISAALCVCCLLLTGCEGPTTRVLPGSPVTRASEEEEMTAPDYTPESANPFYIRETIALLAAGPRESGSDAEKSVVMYLERILKSYGYEVSRQTYPIGGDESVPGINLAAVQMAEKPDSAILIITAHHDSAPKTPGANSCGSGVAGWLEAARLLAGVPGNTELRFISFGSGEDDGSGEAFYMDQLSDDEKGRVVGLISFGDIGYRYSRRTMIQTAKGRPTELGNLLRQYARESGGLNLEYGIYADAPADGRIPMIRLSQENRSYEYHTTQDKPGIVSSESIAQVTDAVVRTVSEVAGVLSPDMVMKTEKDETENAPENAQEEALEEEMSDGQRQILEDWIEASLLPEDFSMISAVRYVWDDEDIYAVLMDNDSAVLTVDAADILGSKEQFTDVVEAENALMRSYGTLLELRSDVSYQAAFEERFYGEDMEEEYVSELAAEGFDKDYAESFRLFVLTDKPEASDRTADAKITFFYEYPELVNLRGHVRGQLQMGD